MINIKTLLIGMIFLSTAAYSQNMHKYETYCRFEVYEKDGWVMSKKDTSCYSLLISDDEQIFVIQNIFDPTNYRSFKIYKSQKELLEWKCISRDEISGDIISINIYETPNYKIVKIDYSHVSIRFMEQKIDTSKWGIGF